MGALVVAMVGKSFAEKVVGEYAGLGKAVHTFSDFGVYPAIGTNGLEIVFKSDFKWNVVDMEVDILVIR